MLSIQSLLSRIGYDPGPIDGIFGQQTRQAVIDFQVDNGLTPDGIVGPATWRQFEVFLEAMTDIGYSQGIHFIILREDTILH